MATQVTYNGVDYNIPAPGDTDDWGASLSAYLIALASGGGGGGGGGHLRASDTSGLATPTSTPTLIEWTTTEFNTTDGLLDAGVFTVGTDGYYRISALVQWTPADVVEGEFVFCYLWLNDEIVAYGSKHQVQENTASFPFTSSVNTTLRLEEDDELTLKVFVSHAGADVSLDVNGLRNYFNIDLLAEAANP